MSVYCMISLHGILAPTQTQTLVEALLDTRPYVMTGKLDAARVITMLTQDDWIEFPGIKDGGLIPHPLQDALTQSGLDWAWVWSRTDDDPTQITLTRDGHSQTFFYIDESIGLCARDMSPQRVQAAIDAQTWLNERSLTLATSAHAYMDAIA